MGLGRGPEVGSRCPPRWGAGGYPCKGFGPFSAALVSGKQEAAEIGRLQLWQGQGHSRAVCVSVCVHVCIWNGRRVVRSLEQGGHWVWLSLASMPIP